MAEPRIVFEPYASGAQRDVVEEIVNRRSIAITRRMDLGSQQLSVTVGPAHHQQSQGLARANHDAVHERSTPAECPR